MFALDQGFSTGVLKPLRVCQKFQRIRQKFQGYANHRKGYANNIIGGTPIKKIFIWETGESPGDMPKVPVYANYRLYITNGLT